jgi:hypothetical protein
MWCSAVREKANCTIYLPNVHCMVKEKVMAKTGPKAQAKIKKVVKEFEKGDLKSGSGQKVKSKKQALAIGYSEARKAGGKVPKNK